MGSREYAEIGLNISGDQKFGAWQIKEIADFALQPRAVVQEKFRSELPADTKSAEVTVRVVRIPSPGKEMVVYDEVRKIDFQR